MGVTIHEGGSSFRAQPNVPWEKNGFSLIYRFPPGVVEIRDRINEDNNATLYPGQKSRRYPRRVLGQDIQVFYLNDETN